jgi:D-alanyl-D-alanine carboxypeptidase
MKSFRFRIFITAFLASLPLWFGINYLANNLENLWFLKIMGDSPSYYSASVIASVPNSKQKTEPAPDINAKAAVSVLVRENGKKSVVYQRNIYQRLPIASLSKLMSAKIILENFDISKNIVFSGDAILEKGLADRFMAGESFKIEDLLFASMVESDNDGIAALTGIIGENSFVDLMNLEAEYLNLENTFFYNSTGLDPVDIKEGMNVSSASDLADLSISVFKNPLISNMLSVKNYNLYLSDGRFHHTSNTTNAILSQNVEFDGYNIVGGKTGYTRLAGECLILVLKNQKNNNVLVNVILGADDRFEEMQKMVDWAVKSAN